MLHENPKQLLEAYRKSWVWELIIIFVTSLALLMFFLYFDIYEKMFHMFLNRFENFDIDELFLCLVVTTLMLSIFSFRRWRELARINRSLRDFSMFDELTDLLNRKGFEFLLKRNIHAAVKTPVKMAVMFINLDNFKNVNNLWKHKFGDIYLKQVADQLNSIIGEDDVLARLGADEFALLLPNISCQTETHTMAKSIIELFDKPIYRNNKSLHVTASIGISMYPADGESTTELIKNAIIAMDEVKTAAGNDYRHYSHDIGEKIQRKILLENELALALERREFILNYQPIYDLSSKKIVSLEALVRWQHPTEGRIPPLEFIPIAEKSKQIIPLGKWILYTACKQMHTWHMLGYTNISISVNVSPVQLHNKNFVTHLRQIISETKIEPQFITLELTEGIRIFNSKVMPVIHELKSIGVRISIDDFGTGYCSFGYLKDFSIDDLKIDKSLIDNIALKATDEAIAKSIISMAHVLDISVTAEGIEEVAQMKKLETIGCDKIQGYLMSRPLPPDEMTNLFSAQNASATA